MNIQKDKTATQKLLIISLVVALLLGVGFAYTYFATDFFSSTPSSDSTGDSHVNLDPPTEQEVRDGQNAKERILEENGPEEEQPKGNTPDKTTKETATVGISYAGVTNEKLEIRAFTPSIIEGTGTCTATITKSGAATITKTAPAFIDASSTICKPIYVPVSDLSAGTWNINVTFSSPTHQGSSGPTSVEIR